MDSKQSKFFASFRFIDSLKFCPNYAPSMHQLLQMTISIMPSSFTRMIMYLIRLVTNSPMEIKSNSVLEESQKIMRTAMVDQSTYSHIIKLSNTNIMIYPRIVWQQEAGLVKEKYQLQALKKIEYEMNILRRGNETNKNQWFIPSTLQPAYCS